MILASIGGKNYAVKTYQNTPVLTFKDVDHFHDYMEGRTAKMFELNKSVMVENKDFFIVSKKELGTDFVTVYKLNSSESTGVLITLTGYLMLCKAMTDKRSFEISKGLLTEYFKTNSPRVNSEDMQLFMEAVNKIHNENHYLLGMIEKMCKEFESIKTLLTPKINEATAISEIQEWSDNAFAQIRKLSRALGVYDRDIIRDICKDERFKGVDFTQLKDEYTMRTKQKNPYLLKVIAATTEERKIFETVLNEMLEDKFGKANPVTSCSLPKITALNVSEIIRPLIAKRGDNTSTHTATYRIVYKTMEIDWDKELESYALKHGLSKHPRKLTLIEEIPSIKDEFKKAVEKLLQ